MKLKKLKELAAQIMKAGQSRIWIDSSQMEKTKEALTKDDVRRLIVEGIVKKKAFIGVSRGRARVLLKKRRAGRKKGFGKRTGTKRARSKSKSAWPSKIRAQRRVLKELKKNKKIKYLGYATLYRMAKGGYFRGKKHLEKTATGEKA